MPWLRRALERLSLRRRFLIPSLLALVVITGITAALVLDARRQNSLIGRVADHDLPEFEQHSRVYLALSEHHMAVFELLRERQFSEEELYDRSRSLILAMRATLEKMRGLTEKRISAMGSEDFDPALHRRALGLAEQYLKSVAAALELSTVDVAHASRQLAIANQRFLEMQRVYAAVLQAESDEVRDEITGSISASERRVLVVIVTGALLCMVLLLVAWTLARLLARSLEQQVATLAELGADASPRCAGDSSEVSRMAHAIDAFREAIARLRIYREVIRSTGEAVAIADREGRIIEVNGAYEQTLGVSREEAIGAPFFGALAAENAPALRAGILAALAGEGHWNGELLQRRKTGESFPSWTTANMVASGGIEAGHFVSVSRDITALKANERALQKLAFFDPLSGLANRALLNDRARVALASARRKDERVAALHIDLDRFKFVNDSLGHAAGDRVLVEVAHRLSQQVRATDTLARVGGDEFVILLSTVDTDEDAFEVAERAIACISQPLELGGGPVFVGASVGVAFFPDDAADLESLHKCADLAMYEAKQGGRGQWRRFSRKLVERARERLTLSTEIELALEDGRFEIHYQPIVDLASGEVCGAEALIRWPQPDGSSIAPATFIPHAEEIGLIKRIDLWVLERACADASRWQRHAAAPVEISVNVSAVSLQQPELPDQLAAILERTGLPPSCLRLEITETVVIANPHVAASVLRTISETGVRVSLDDFGTGYSSLHYLVQFPIHRIKLDRSFVGKIGKDAASEEIIRSLLDLAKRLGIGVVAEGVEHLRQRAFLADAGCGYMQGYCVARALPFGELLEFTAPAWRRQTAPALAA